MVENIDQKTYQKIRSFTDLDAWKKGHELVVILYSVTNSFPSSEQFGLTNQLRRAVVSITSNIAEGFSRNSFKEKLQFYAIALGSLSEVQNQILIARDVGYMSQEQYASVVSLTTMVSRLLNGLIKFSKTVIHNT